MDEPLLTITDESGAVVYGPVPIPPPGGTGHVGVSLPASAFPKSKVLTVRVTGWPPMPTEGV